MTVHFHGTPISPMAILQTLAGRCFCVSHADPRDVERAHAIAQAMMLDNGAFSDWRKGRATNWPRYYAWTDRWLDWPTTWAVVPDKIDAGAEHQDALIREWPHGRRQAAPVWHLDEPFTRLCRLCDEGWNRVCVGSTSVYSVVLSPAWQRRMDDAFRELALVFGRRTPPLHMLRGMQCSGRRWPFASVDSTDVARNHNRPGKTALAIAERWDVVQCAPGHDFAAGPVAPPIPGLFAGAA